jgi:hypothetical protein
MTTYKIEEVVGSRDWDSRNGAMKDYTLALEGVPEQVRLTQKAETPAPAAGQEMDLTLEDFPQEQVERYAPLANMKKAKKVQQGGFGGGGFGGPRPEDPKRNAGIVRQHSQDMAIQIIRLGLELSIMEKPADMKGLLIEVRRTADYLDADVQRVRDAV